MNDVIFIIIFIFAGFLLLFFGYKKYKTARSIEDMPTSKIRSVAMGLAELNGKSLKYTDVLKAPISGKDCVYYYYKIEKYISNGKNSGWKTLTEMTQSTKFYLQDDTGTIIIDPKGAEIKVENSYYLETYENALLPNIANLIPRMLKLGSMFSLTASKIRITEKLIGLDKNYYTIGNVSSISEGLLMSKSGSWFASTPFYITDKSEKSLTRNLKIFGVVLILLGFVFTGIGVFVGLGL